jgi:hypothetical protein
MEDRRPAIVGVTIAFQVLSWVSMAMRLYVRRFKVKRVGSDDSKFLSSRTGSNEQYLTRQLSFQLQWCPSSHKP